MRLVSAALLALVPLAVTPAGAAAGSCPAGFHLHDIGDGDHEHGDHQHVGLSMTALDRNSNGLICVPHVTPDGAIHVHIDDIPS